MNATFTHDAAHQVSRHGGRARDNRRDRYLLKVVNGGGNISGNSLVACAVAVVLLVVALSATVWAQWEWDERLPEGRRVIPELMPANATDGTFAVL